MPTPNNAALEFLLTRRSRPAKLLGAPYPSRDELEPILTAGARCPDHGKLEPWRFVVLSGAAPARLASLAREHGTALGLEPEKVEKVAASFDGAGLIVTVIEVQKPSDKIPPVEQTYSAGAACLSLLNAALAAGWGANWLSGAVSHDAGFARAALDLAPNERIAGFIHIGTERSAPPERPRPDLLQIVTWVDA